MSTVMESPTKTAVERRPIFSAIRWTAIFGGLVAGVGSYILLALLGVAVGLSAIDLQEGQPVGAVSVGTGIWSGLSMLISAFIGAYVAVRMSGLGRKVDGLLHGFVTWGATTLLFAWLATTAVSSILGGTLGLVGQTLQGVGGVSGSVTNQLETLITGSAQGEIQMQDIQTLQNRLQAGDRQGAIDVMVNQMGFETERANQVVDQAMAILGPRGEQQIQQAAEQTASSLSAVSWWLFIGLALSLGAAIWGGIIAVKANSGRTIGDHSGQRRQTVATH